LVALISQERSAPRNRRFPDFLEIAFSNGPQSNSLKEKIELLVEIQSGNFLDPLKVLFQPFLTG